MSSLNKKRKTAITYDEASSAATQITHELFRRGELSFLLHSSQSDVYTSLRTLDPKARQPVVLIARRWGKSYLGAVMAIEDCLRKPGAQVFIAAPTIKQTNEIVVPLIQMIAMSAPEGLFAHAKSTLRWDFHNGSTLIIGGFDTATESFRGKFADAIYLEESGSAAPDSFDYTVQSVLLPTLMHSRGRIYHLTTPAVQIDHPLHTKTIPKADSRNAFFRKSIYDSPLMTAEMIAEEAEAQGGEDSAAWKREYLCLIERDAATVAIPSFDKSLHVAPLDPPAHAKWMTAIDWGGVRDKTVALLCLYDYKAAKFCVMSEYQADANTETSAIVAGILEIEASFGLSPQNPPTRWADAHGQTQVDLNAMQFPVRLPLKDDWASSIANLNLGFHQNQILISDKCKFLLLSIENGRFNKSRTDFDRSILLGHCDAIAALMYAFRMKDISNPYPKAVLNPETHWMKNKPSDELTRLARTLLPFTPHNKR